ncbi:MAG: hypothetical protein J6Y47_03930 [Bacteroidales bacterium]|nr:hypothetical protein [Bacteroidales bacterium]
MTMKTALDNLVLNYGNKCGKTRDDFFRMIKSGVENYGLSVRACYLGIKMIASQETGEEEIFTSADVAEMTGESIEEVNARIEDMIAHPTSYGMNPESIISSEPPVRFMMKL